jgi:hypothetical protein
MQLRSTRTNTVSHYTLDFASISITGTKSKILGSEGGSKSFELKIEFKVF